MQFRQSFSKNFKFLRLSHQLSGKAISDMLGIKGSGHIAMWETQKNIPSLELLNQIIILFAVSSDWLLGYTDKPYNEKVIVTVEEMFFNLSFNSNGKETPLLTKTSWIPNEYWEPELRSKTYSLPVRANIIFLLNNYLSSKIDQLEEQEKLDASSQLVRKIMNRKNELKNKTLAEKRKKEQLDLYFKQLQELLAAKESAKPIFDITKTT